MTPRLRVALAAHLVLFCVSTGAQERVQDPSRQRPPEGFRCARNDLTVYTGLVTGLSRAVGRTTLRIRTDWETTEVVTLRHPGTDDPSALFRYAGAPFTPADWPRVATATGALRPGTRASAWVCTDGQVLVDWEAPRE